MRESAVETALVEAVKDRGGIAYKFTSPNRPNVPDRLVLLPGGRARFVECKAPGERPTPAQLREHQRLAALGFEVAVLDEAVLAKGVLPEPGPTIREIFDRLSLAVGMDGPDELILQQVEFMLEKRK